MIKIEEIKPDPRTLIAPESEKGRWVENMEMSAYHSDKTAVSGSSAKTIIQVSPKTFFHTFYIAGEREPSDAMRLGTLAHMAILEGAKFREKYIVEPVFQGFTKKGEPTTNPNALEVKEAKARWYSDLPSGSIVTTIEERDKILGMIDSLLSHAKANEFLSAGIAECTGIYRDPETGIRCRIRPDFMCRKRAIMVNLKTCDDVREEAFKHKIFSDRGFGGKPPFWYDFSAAMEVEGFFQIEQRKVEIAAWVAVGSSAPHEVAVHPMTVPVHDIGQIKYRRAMNKIKECIDAGRWPGVQESGDYSFIVPPDYLLEEYGVNFDTELI